MAEIKQENENQLEHIYYNRDVLHKHTKAVQKIIDLAVDYVPYAERLSREGKNVVWVGIPGGISTFIYACDAIPVFVGEYGRLRNTGGLEISEDYFQLPNETCSMVKVVLGEYFLHKDETIKKIIYSSKMCEPFNQLFEMIKPYGYDIYVVDTGFRPSGEKERLDKYREFSIQEYKKAAEWLSGKPLNEEKLRYEMKRYNRILRKIRTILNLRKKHSTYILSLSTMLMLMGSDHYFGKPEEYEDALDELIEELSALKEGEYNTAKINLVWSGGRGVEFGIYQTVDEAGGAIQGWNTPNNLEQEFNLSKEPMEAYMDFDLGDKLAAGSTEDACKAMEKQIELCNAKGIILYGYMGCSFGSIDSELKRNYFRKRDIPALSLVGTYQIGAPSGQLITRVKAFIEMLSK